MRGKRIVSIITAVVLLAGCSSAKNMSSEELTQIDQERNAKKSEGDNNHINKNKHIALAFLVPMIMHGAYDFVASMKGRLWIMLFFFLVAGYEVIGIVKVNEASKAVVQLK